MANTSRPESRCKWWQPCRLTICRPPVASDGARRSRPTADALPDSRGYHSPGLARRGKGMKPAPLGCSCIYVTITQDGRIVDSLGMPSIQRIANERTDAMGHSVHLGDRDSSGAAGFADRGIPCVPRHHHRLLRPEYQPANLDSATVGRPRVSGAYGHRSVSNGGRFLFRIGCEPHGISIAAHSPSPAPR